MIEIEHDLLVEAALKRNPKIEELVFDADFHLRAINPCAAKTNPEWCFNLTDICLAKYNQALTETDDFIIKEYCRGQIEITSQIRNFISVKIPLTKYPVEG